MDVLEEGIQEFQEIYKRAYGVELSREEALAESTKLLEFLSLINEVELQEIEDIRKPFIPPYLKELADLNNYGNENNTDK